MAAGDVPTPVVMKAMLCMDYDNDDCSPEEELVKCFTRECVFDFRR